MHGEKCVVTTADKNTFKKRNHEFMKFPIKCTIF